MTNSEFESLEKQEYEYLDTIDILSIQKDNDIENLEELRNILEEDYEDDYLEKNSNDDFLFNCINLSDFAHYLRKRYNIDFREEIAYYFQP